MDFLQIALIFLIILISIFLAISGFQVFFILRDLHKNLKRFDKILGTSQNIAEDIEKPAKLASKPKNRRFYKKVL